MRSTLTALIVATVTIVLGTSACSSSPESTEARPEPSASMSLPPTASPTPTKDPVTCQTLVTPAALHKLTSDGSEFNEDFEGRIRDEPAVFGLRTFLDYGGLACQWGFPNSDSVTVLGYSPLTAERAASARANLLSEGWTPSMQADGSEIWTTADVDSSLGYRPAYVFTAGSWRYALDLSTLGYFAQ